MLLKPPYSFAVAEELCERYKSLIGKKIEVNGVHILTVCDVLTCPFNEYDRREFISEYSCEIHIPMKEVLYQGDYDIVQCDVAIFMCMTGNLGFTEEGFTTRKLHEYLQESLQYLSPSDTL